jgi:hypothetical protein
MRLRLGLGSQSAGTGKAMKAVTPSEKRLEKNKNDLQNSEQTSKARKENTRQMKNNSRTRIVCQTLRADF